jgi:translation initiation factor 4E
MAQVAQSPVPLDTIPVSPEGGDAASDAAPTTSSGDVVTVFHDADNFNVKHPLAHTWTLWFTKPPSGKVIAPQDDSAVYCSDTISSKTGTNC